MKSRGQLFLVYFVLVILLFLTIFFAVSLAKDVQKVIVYHDFCEGRSNFCYCNLVGCEFKIVETSINGFSTSNSETQNVEALCALAEKLKDKEVMFKANCGGINGS